jgi:hypothetical protein
MVNAVKSRKPQLFGMSETFCVTLLVLILLARMLSQIVVGKE